jgi:hypothetical protein
LPKPFDVQEVNGSHGFIVPNGEFIALDDVDRMCVYMDTCQVLTYDITGLLCAQKRSMEHVYRFIIFSI